MELRPVAVALVSSGSRGNRLLFYHRGKPPGQCGEGMRPSTLPLNFGLGLLNLHAACMQPRTTLYDSYHLVCIPRRDLVDKQLVSPDHF